MSEAGVSIADRLYSSRRMLRGLLGTEYPAHVRTYMQVIEANDHGQGTLRTGMRLVEALLANDKNMGAAWIMAAIVELLEPDDVTPQLN